MTIEFKPEQSHVIAEAIHAGLIKSPGEALDIAVDALRSRLQASARPVNGEGQLQTVDESQGELPAKRPASRKSLAQLFAASPLKGLDLKFERDPDTGRPVEL